MSHPARWWAAEPGSDKIRCELCPRACRLGPGQRAFCFVRQNEAGRMVLTTYGRSTGFCIDPIEKKPLNHFHPGTPVLSFGTAGCNLGCRFCQNWSISKAQEIAKLSDEASPQRIARAARELGCSSVAFTYNDPVIWAEYAIDVARACREEGVKTVAVTAGYITEAAREEFFADMDAANVDLKAFNEQFYHKLCFAHLEPVLDTLRWLVRRTRVWVEITTLLIPGDNDSPEEVDKLCDWVARELGRDVPLHFTAFHPDFRWRDRPPTPSSTLVRARRQALQRGLRYVYCGNLSDADVQSTWCPGCGQLVIERDRYQVDRWGLREGRCAACGTPIAGHFGAGPGTWGERRQRVKL